MGGLKDILLQCRENEKDYQRYGVISRDRDINRGWLECCEFFLRNFDLTEKEVRDDA